jgi:hypothetical protein
VAKKSKQPTAFTTRLLMTKTSLLPYNAMELMYSHDFCTGGKTIENLTI